MTKFKKSKFSLDEVISNSKFNYTKNLKWFLIAPVVICFVGLILLCTVGFNLGLDFTGGASMTIFVDKDGIYTVDNSKYDIDKDFGVIEEMVEDVLKNHELKVGTIQKTAMNEDKLSIENGDAVLVKFQVKKDATDEEISKTNEEIRLELLKKFGFVEESTVESELTDIKNSGLVINNDVTTETASSELMMKSFIALLVAVVLILIYVAIRFEFTSGLAAILALFHDILVTASMVLIFRIQVNVAFIAALITILGYSINNTIIIFDRMRDELKLYRQSGMKIDNDKIANVSIKDTMTRSILTMITTFIMIFMITVIGVADIREFAFPIMIGIIAGFYSSVFLTPGLWAIAYRPRKTKKSTNNKPKQVVED